MTFAGEMLVLARQIRKVTQKGLSERLGGSIDQGTLSKIERGRVTPSPEQVDAFARELGVRPSFFAGHGALAQPPVSYHRKRKKLAARDLASVHGVAEVLRVSLSRLLEGVDLEHDGPALPSYDLDQFGGDATEAARNVRVRLRLPRGPVRSVSHVVEASGAVIVPFDFGTPLIDGFCQHAQASLPNVVFVNTALPVDRMRFSLAHEMGHLVCHDVPSAEQEDEANRFASEFLMPTADIAEDLVGLDLRRAMELKLHWGTSMHAIVYKAWETGGINDARRKNLYIEMSRRGWRRREPVAIAHVERPTTFADVLEAYRTEIGYSDEDLADMFGISTDDLVAYFPAAPRRPRLRVVSSN